MTEVPLSTMLAFFIYVTIVLFIGLYAYLRTKNATDYFLGGRKLSASVSAISAGAPALIAETDADNFLPPKK